MLTLLSARGTPIARRFEIWDARSTTVGKEKQAVLVDGICAREGAIWNKERRVNAWHRITSYNVCYTKLLRLAIAYEKKYFEDEGLFVTLEAQANWKVLLDRVIDGQLDGAHMLAGQPLAATIGYGTEAHIVTPFSMDLNGNGITVSNEIWAQMKEHIPQEDGKPVHPISASALKPVVEKYKSEGKPFNIV